jgi:ABC-type nitrate/sulfonate/bicarbonate transport system substrate-binding protein
MRRRSALALLGSLFVGCQRESTPAAGEPLKIGLAIASHVHAVAWIAKERGFFAAEGIDADVQVTGGSAAAIRTLIAGQVDVALAGGDSVLKASWAGADLVVAGGLVDRFYHRIVARRGIERGADLHGKKLGLPFLGGPQDMAAQFALRKLGLAYGKDVEIVSLGKDMNLVMALERAEIDLATSELPKARLARLGLPVIADLPADPVRFPYLVVAVKRDFFTAREAAARRTLAALSCATSWYQDPNNRDASLAIIGAHLRTTDPAAALELHEDAGPRLLTLPLVPNRAAFETAVELAGRGEADKNRLDRLLDARLVGEGRCR